MGTEGSVHLYATTKNYRVLLIVSGARGLIKTDTARKLDDSPDYGIDFTNFGWVAWGLTKFVIDENLECIFKSLGLLRFAPEVSSSWKLSFYGSPQISIVRKFLKTAVSIRF